MSDNEYTSTLAKGVEAAKSGNRLVARLHLMKATGQRPDAAAAHVWLAYTAETFEDALPHLEVALERQPNNKLARLGFLWTKGLAEFDASCDDCGALSAMLDLPAVEVAHSHSFHQSAVQSPPDFDDDADSGPSVADVFPAADVAEDLDGEQPTGLSTWRFVSEPPEESLEEQIHSSVAELSESVEATCHEHTSEDRSRNSIADEDCSPTPESTGEADLQAGNITADRMCDSVFTPSTLRRVPWNEIEDDGRPLVMVVDESPTVRKLIAITVSQAGYRVVCAADGYEAIRKLAEVTPHAIVMEIALPRVDGVELCTLLRQHPDTRELPVIVVTTKSGPVDRLRARRAGVTEYLTKPFDAQRLLSVISKYCPTCV